MVAALFSMQISVAQCELDWLAGSGVPGADGDVFTSVAWDPDGPGPMAERVVVAGSFATVGAAAALGIASWNSATGEWSPLGVNPALNGQVLALAVLPDGRLLVGGTFSSAGGVSANRLATWDGNTWAEFAGGANGSVHAAVVMPDGDVVIGGGFSSVGGVTAGGLARWDGSTWTQVGQGASAFAMTLAAGSDGDLYVGGLGLSIVGASVNAIARWDGVSWSDMAGGLAIQSFGLFGVRAMQVMSNGDLIVGGRFDLAGGVAARNIARWDGASWHPYGAGFNGGVLSLAVLSGGDLIAGGEFGLSGSQSVRGMARWTGSAWAPLGVGFPISSFPFSVDVNTLTALQNGDLIAGGDFDANGGQPGQRVSRWNGSQWFAMGGGVGGPLNCAVYAGDGDLVVGGDFGSIAGVAVGNVARRDGVTWSSLGGGVNGEVEAIVEMPNGDLVAGGAFTRAGGVAIARIARWNGASWAPLAGGSSQRVSHLAVLPDGDLVATGQFVDDLGQAVSRIARWNGASWSELAGGLDGQVQTLHVAADGKLYAGGNFNMAGGMPAPNAAVFDGVGWSALAGGVLGIRDIITLADGLVLAANSQGIFQWDGAAWSALATTTSFGVQSMLALPNGDVIAAGNFTNIGGIAANRIARFDGGSWTAFGDGVDLTVATLAMRADGRVAVAGSFSLVDGMSSASLGELRTPCPAASQPAGEGCASSGGGNTLRAETLAWTGGALEVSGTGLPSTSLVAIVTGFGPASVPLSAVIAQGVPGCVMHLQPAFCDWMVTMHGAIQSQTPIPSAPDLVGRSFLHQLVLVEVDSGPIVAVTTSNALALTIGALE